jgi:hypothetical protein
MSDSREVSGAHPSGDRPTVEPASGERRSPAVDTFAGKVHVEWAPEEAVTPLGQLPFFIDYLKQAGLFDPWVADCPLAYTSPNAPGKRDLLGTLMLALLVGAKRYVHVTALRNDSVNPALLGMKRVCSDDSVRRALKALDPEEATTWLQQHLDYVFRPLLAEPWILDVDSSVKPIYGHQEGAEVGYNPTKPGRPSHVYHTYAIAQLRLVLDTVVMPGNQHHGSHGLPGLTRLLDGMAAHERPYLVRGDADYGAERTMADLERRGQDYLFRLRMTTKVKRQLPELAAQRGWRDVGQGWQAAETRLRLSGWKRKRRVVVLRRAIRKDTSSLLSHETDASGQAALGPVEVLEANRQIYEYTALVTSLDGDLVSLASLYRDRADAENLFDELKNHWGWGGFTTRDLARTRITARITALVYNWWSLFVRLVDPTMHREAITSRPLLMAGVARATQHAGRTTLAITSQHAHHPGIRQALTDVADFLDDLRRTAPQLTAIERWCRILARALSPYLFGRTPKPPPNLLPA